jgi:hypothetical protein
MFLGVPNSSHAAATVVEVLPATGLAYLVGDDSRSWAITKSTPGLGLDTLMPGKRLDLTIVHRREFDIVSAYSALDGGRMACESAAFDGQP